MTETIETVETQDVADNSETSENQEPQIEEPREVLGDNSNDNEENTEPEQTQQEDEEKQPEKNTGKFDTLDDALKGYSELEKKLGQQSNELGELRKQAQEAQKLKEQIAQIQLQEANARGFDSVKSFQDHRQAANFTADEYAKHLRECEYPDEMVKLLREYRNNPSSELLESIESQFPVDTIKDVAAREALFRGQLQAKENLARENQIIQSAREYLNTNVNKYADVFKNPAFAALYGEAFRAYGCDLNTDRFVELMKNYASSIAKASGIKNGINQENINATAEIAGLTDGSNAANNRTGSGKSLLNMSEKELDKRLSELI